MPSKKIIFLFAPKFKEFGVDIANTFLKKNPDWQVGGLCTGGSRTVDVVKNSLKPETLFGLWDMEKIESEWLEANKVDNEVLNQIDKVLGVGASGEIITSDRRIGVGYVRGGECRPDKFGEMCKQNSVDLPQKYLHGLYSFLSNTFYEYKPSLVFCYAVAGGPATAMGLLCKAMGIKFYRFSPTRVSDEFILDDDYKGRLKPIEKTFVSGETDPISIRKAEKYLNEYRKKPIRPGYYVRNSYISKKNNLVPYSIDYLKHYFAYICIKFIPNIEYNASLIGLKRRVFTLKQEFRKLQIIRKNAFLDKPINSSYIFFPLHVEPEASTMVLSSMHTDQVSVIEALSKSLSGNQILVVKEHLPMLGKRPKGFYELIQKMPRVVLISPFHDSLDLIKNSEAVAVITGTAAFEALLLKRKAIVIGDSPYLAIGKGIVHETSLANLPQAVGKLNEIELADDETLIKYLASVFSCSFTMKTSVLWDSYNKVDEDEKSELLRIIVDKLRII